MKDKYITIRMEQSDLDKWTELKDRYNSATGNFLTRHKFIKKILDESIDKILMPIIQPS